jgi:Amt family ammonium transporter
MKRFFLNFIISFFMILSFQNLYADNHEMVMEEPIVEAVVEAESALNSGDTAWMITATVLVIAMTIPGLALFYGGLVRAKNMLSVLMQVFVTFCLMAVIWILWGYSLAATEGNAFIGDLSKIFLKGVTPDSMSGSIPEYVFIGFQLTFACITPALIVGAFAERIKFSAVLLFMALWMTICYTPVWHWVWGGGFLSTLMGIGAVDFAGGTVVHINAGVAALVGALLLGPRIGYGKEAMPPHNLPFTMIGASLLWVGWFGFNAGSQLAADGQAAMSLLVTHISASVASLTWMLIEWKKNGKPGLVGIVTGTIAGLATITPASGSVGPIGAIIIGFSAGLVCYFMCGVIKGALKIDDSLDVFAVHGVGGILGTLLVAFLAADTFGGNGGVDFNALAQLKVQAIGVVTVVAWSAIATIIIITICKLVTGLRVSEETETIGLDEAEHGENAYNFD